MLFSSLWWGRYLGHEFQLCNFESTFKGDASIAFTSDFKIALPQRRRERRVKAIFLIDCAPEGYGD